MYGYSGYTQLLYSYTLVIWKALQEDHAISKGLQTKVHSSTPPTRQQWNQHPLPQYPQLWAQIKIVDGVLCRDYTPSPVVEAEAVTLSILHTALRQVDLQCNNSLLPV